MGPPLYSIRGKCLGMQRRSGIGRNGWLPLGALAAGSTLVALVLSWTALGTQFDTYAYDFIFRLEPPASWQPSSAILAIDEETLQRYGGLTGLRSALADGLEKIAASKPAGVAVDMILAEPNPVDDRLESAFAMTPNLVLACDLLPDGSRWEEPIARFAAHAAAVGEVHADPDKLDAISRDIPLEKAAGRERRWTLALATYLAVKHLQVIESPDDLAIGDARIPASDRDGRTMRIRYAPPAMGGIPRVSVAQLDRDPALASRFAGKVVFAGVTAQTVSDRWMTPYSNTIPMPGIELNANAWETIDRRMFLTDARLAMVAFACLVLAAAAIFAFSTQTATLTNAIALAALAGSQAIPAIAFAQEVVWPWMPGTLAAILATAAGAAWRHIRVRGRLETAEREKTRYQQSMQFAIHELRTPLTAIQGSSELISRYAAMPEGKRKEMADQINAESKRLARMIETFLNVERLSSGQMEMKQERFAPGVLAIQCVERAKSLAERKRIAIEVNALPEDEVTGDRELMEYAVYNLLTNAVKYSPADTRIRVFGSANGGEVRLAVEDEGIGMDRKEVKQIFDRFYRTEKAEKSGEAGTGIGLSIVEKIVAEHGGSIEVESEPGKGSRFTLVLKRA